MTNPNQRQTYNREVQQSDIEPGNAHTQVTHTTETVNNTEVTPNRESYRDGYAHGRVVERNYQQVDLVERDNNNAARGLLLGILITSLAAFTAGVVWYFNQRPDETPTPATAPVVIPDPAPEAAETSPPPAASQPPERETTIIEREKPVYIPVPQQQAPTAPPVPANPQSEEPTPPSPAAAPAPTTQQTAPSQPQSQSDSTESAMPSDPNAAMPDDAAMPDAGNLEQPSTTPDNGSTPNDASAPNDTSNSSSSTP